MQQVLNGSYMFKFSMVFFLFRYMVLALARGRPNMHDFIIETWHGCPKRMEMAVRMLRHISLTIIAYLALLYVKGC